jgi:NAD(P)H-hydrate epimerase
VFNPDLTISFQTPKMAFLIPENASFVGDWNIVDIGLNDAFIRQTKTRNYLITDETIAHKLKKRKKFAHKGDFGKGIIISGGYGMMGASILSARACMRTGIGLLTLHIPQCGYNILQSSVPEAMVSTDKSEFFISSLPNLSDYSAIGVGPGIGTHSETINMMQKLFENNKTPLVLDADALNIISKSPSLIEKIPVNSILTPHIKEFERISGPSKNHYERLQKLTVLATKHHVFIVLKGAFTAVSTPEGKTYFNSTGNPGMATGGSGDVLTGIITSLLAQNYTPEEASLIGVYIHGMAGDIAASKFGHEGMISSDIIDCIPQSISILKKK